MKQLDDFNIHVKLKISALWISVMFCYLYADHFGLYVPGNLQSMLQGQMGPLGPTTQGVLLFTSAMMAIPSVMVFLSVALKAKLSRWLNILFGVLYTAIILGTMWDWTFFIFYGVIEVTLTGLIVVYAWKWPKQEVA